VALSGDGTIAIVSAAADEEPNGTEAGSAYVFEVADGSWSQQTKLAADDGDDEDGFGDAVTLSNDGTTAIVGAKSDEDPNGDNAGAAYVFVDEDGWSQQAKLAADDGDSFDYFGDSVAVSGDGTTAIVGAESDEDPNGPSAGAAYVFEQSSGSWSQQAKLAADDGDDGDNFGSVTLSKDGTTAIIGAKYDEDPNGEGESVGAGSAYVFTDDGGWSQQAKLAADDGDGDDQFGFSVAISSDGTTAIIGANNDEDPNGSGEDWYTGAGAAYVFEQSDGTWSQGAKLAADDGDAEDTFGESVALSDDGTTALVGARFDEDPNGYEAGSAYVFEASSDTWSQRAKLAADDGDEGDEFGNSVSVSADGTTALVGTWDDEDPNGEVEFGSGAGSAYVFDV
jgi:hypothetical protein